MAAQAICGQAKVGILATSYDPKGTLVRGGRVVQYSATTADQQQDIGWTMWLSKPGQIAELPILSFNMAKTWKLFQNIEMEMQKLMYYL